LAISLAWLNPVSAAIIPPLKQPKWAELSPQQREILAPLSGEWDKLESFRRKKWLGIVQRYPALSADEQQRIQRRMKAWADLTPEERKRAREQFKTLQKVPAEQRQTVKQRWQEYQSLPDSEKQRLQQNSKQKSQPKSGSSKTLKTTPAGVPKTPSTVPTPPASSETAVPVVTPGAAPTSGAPAANPVQR